MGIVKICEDCEDYSARYACCMDIDITLFFTMIYNVDIIKHIEICDALNIIENTKKQHMQT
jgi:hypothetical protein